MENYTPVFTITPEILTLAYGIAGDLERINIFRERALTPQLRKENRIKTIHSSLWIEANSLTLEQVTAIVEGKHVAGPAKDIQEVRNAIVAYDELTDCDPYSEQDLLKQHALLMRGLIAHAGQYRTGDVGVFDGEVPLHIAPPSRQVPVLMAQLFDWVKTAPLPQVVKSCIFHYEFEYIHPFSDGNGRMGRMWQTLLLYQENPLFAWLPVESIVARNQQEYYRALRRSTAHNDSGIFAQFMLSALKEATADFKARYRRGELQSEDVSKAVNGGVKLSAPQAKIIAAIAADNHITQAELVNRLQMSRSTVYRHIEKLKAAGLLSRAGSDKTGVWVIKKPEHV